MSSSMRAGVLVCVTVLGMGATGSAQERKGGEPPEPERPKVFSQVEGRIAILSLTPEGTRVKKGDLVCELDNSVLQERSASQKIVRMGSENAYRGAQLDREDAEMALTEYVEGTFKREYVTIKTELSLAQSELKRAEDRLETSNRMYDKSQVSKAQNIADKVGLEQKKFAMEVAQTKLSILERYTKERTIKKLKGEVEKAKGEETLRQAVLEREKKTGERLTRQIEDCKLLAPASGRVHYPRPFEVGETVARRQLLFLVIPDEELRDGAKPSK